MCFAVVQKKLKLRTKVKAFKRRYMFVYRHAYEKILVTQYISVIESYLHL